MVSLPKEYVYVDLIDDTGTAVRVTKDEIYFSVDKVSSRKPDRADITILNLNESLRRLVSAESTTVALYAGTTDPPPLLFSAPIDDVSTARSADFTDWETRITAEDTKRKLRDLVVARSFPAGMNLAQVFSDLAIAGGTVADVSTVVGVLNAPLPLLGTPSKLLAEVCEDYPYRYQIIAGIIVVVLKDAPLTGVSVPVISAATGLRGVPTSNIEKRIVKVTAETRLDANLQPGGLCVIETTSTTGSRKAPIPASGLYFIERASFSRDPGTAFTATVTGREYG